METIVISQDMARRSMAEQFRELLAYRSLIWAMIERDLRVRYKNSVIGIFWSMINPLAQAFILTVVFKFILNVTVPNMSAFIFCALIPWMFFQTAILDSSQSILGQLGLLKKVYFPREIPVIASVGANFIHLLISAAVFIFYRWGILTLITRHWPGMPPREILYLPFVMVVLFLLSLGFSLMVAALNVFYEDIKFIVTIVLQFVMYLTPILYFAEMINYSSHIPPSLRSPIYHIYLLNPIAWIVGAFKQVFFGPTFYTINTHKIWTAPFDIRYGLIALVVSTAVCVYGYGLFNSVKWRFTERP